MINLLKDLVSKLLILFIAILIATKIIKTKSIKNPKASENQIILIDKTTKNDNLTRENKEVVINNLVEKLNAHIDEQAYLLSHYTENEINEEKLQTVHNNIIEIKKDATAKNIKHLIDMAQLKELENQIYIYNQTLKLKNKS